MRRTARLRRCGLNCFELCWRAESSLGSLSQEKMQSRFILVFCVLFFVLAIIIPLCSAESCSTEGDLRLTETVNIRVDSDNTGRLEVCLNGQWGTIAAGSFTTPWSEKNAQVACRQLGFSGALNSIFQNTLSSIDRAGRGVPVHYGDVVCNGLESRLDNCSLEVVTDTAISHRSDVFIVCRPTEDISNVLYSPLHLPGPHDGDIRLLGSTENEAGAVEVYTDNLGWTGICPDSWTTNDAGAVCITLGYQTGSAILFSLENETLPRATGVQCNYPWMTSILSPTAQRVCDVISPFTSNCTAPSGTYAGVRCISRHDQGEFRLFDISDSESIVEVFYGNRWGAVCSSNFDLNTGQVLCQFAGFSSVQYIYRLRNASIKAYQKPVWLTDVNCASNDRTIIDCPRSHIVGFGDCSVNIPVVACFGQSFMFTDSIGTSSTTVPGDNENAGLTIGLIVGLAGGLPLVGFILLIVCAPMCTSYFEKDRKYCLCGCCPRWACKQCCDCCRVCCCDCRTECCCACECGLEEPTTPVRFNPPRDDNIRLQELRLRGDSPAVVVPEPIVTTMSFKPPTDVDSGTSAKFSESHQLAKPSQAQYEATAPPTAPESCDPAFISAPPPSYEEALSYPRTK